MLRALTSDDCGLLRRPDGSSGRVLMIADELELPRGADLEEPLRSFTDPDEDEDVLSSVRTFRAQ